MPKEYFNSFGSYPLLQNYWNSDEKVQKLHDEFIENTITNFYIPLESPHFLINGNTGRFRWQSKKALLSLRHLIL
jgi:hypothetical protein